MHACLNPPPFSEPESVAEILHGVPVTDPYRWLEDQDSPRTRAWIAEQTAYSRSYLHAIPGRALIRQRIREFLAVEAYDSLQKAGDRYFFRKRLPDQEQPSIYMRDGADGEDQLLIDPAERATGAHTAVKPLRVSPDGRLLLYEVKEGGEKTGVFELLEIQTRKRLPDLLAHGYLRGFVFAPDGKSFYFTHEALNAKRPYYRAVYHHVLGTDFSSDKELFFGGEDKRVRLFIFPGERHFGIYVNRCFEKTYTDFYIRSFDLDSVPSPVVTDADFRFEPILLNDRILALTDLGAPNLRIIAVRNPSSVGPQFIQVVPEHDTPISAWNVAGEHILVSYIRNTKAEVHIHDFSGLKIGGLEVRDDECIRLNGGLSHNKELFFEKESFTEPISTWRYSSDTTKSTVWAKRRVPFNSADYSHLRVSYPSKDGTQVPMFLMGRRDVLTTGDHPTIMTSYGGHGISVTPQFSVFVAFLAERGCLFALPSIRGGSEFGVQWHNAAKRRNRQTAFDDFLCAAEWLIETGRTARNKLAIFGGSNSGLLVGAALTQRPDLFRAVVCMVPMLDMLRYHLFDESHIWKDEFGTADDPDDFAVLSKYSPYHQVHQGVAYPATMLISGDADTNCNPLHARKMTARMQAANSSELPIFLDYSKFRGHSPVLPLSERIEALTDRMAFLCDQLELPV
jgi:prolyl oligopeptidase